MTSGTGAHADMSAAIGDPLFAPREGSTGELDAYDTQHTRVFGKQGAFSVRRGRRADESKYASGTQAEDFNL